MQTSNDSSIFANGAGLGLALFLLACVAVIVGMIYVDKWDDTHASFYQVEGTTRARLIARDDQRAMTGVQNHAIQRNVNACLPAVLTEVVRRHINRELPLNQFNPDVSAQDAEQVCTTRLLDSVAVGNPEGAQALAALLQEHQYAISFEYAKAAVKNDGALASVRF